MVSFSFCLKRVVYVASLSSMSVLVFLSLRGALTLPVSADPSSTQVLVDNDPPSFTTIPYEDPASTSSSPANVGNSITFRATADDGESHQYYLAICTTNAVTAGDDAAPTCDDGEWCISGATNDEAAANCSYQAQVGDSESEDWYAFACDKVEGNAECSSASTGSGDSGSPFNVNHRPSFSATSAGSDDPGGTITFSSTASDSDTNGTADQVRLVVCADTSGATYSGCSGTQLCISSNAASDPSCQYNLPSVVQDGNFNYYAYIFDSHGFASADNYRSSTYTVNNVDPVVSNVTLNNSNNMNLTENTTTGIMVTATITDSNSCQDISDADAYLYRSDIGYATNCDEDTDYDPDSCYSHNTGTSVISCVVSTSNTCDGNTDASVGYECTVQVQFHADPTDVDTEYPSENWLATILAEDVTPSSTGATEVATGVEMNSLAALSLNVSEINYGTVSPGSDTGSTNVTTIVTATGNVGIDTELSGTDMMYTTNTITVDYQHYSLSTFTYTPTPSAPEYALSTTSTGAELNCPKTYYSGSRVDGTANIYWGIGVPASRPAGVYTGIAYVVAVKGEVVDW